MATYTSEDLAAGFEFKFLRSASGRFRDPDFLRQSLADEARAGWTLVEKFDNQRIRLKRPAAARLSDPALQFDPYRTSVGMSDTQLGLTIAGIVLLSVGLLLLLVFMMTRG